MSNPLSMFRKYQYILLVVFGIMLMVAFIVLPPLGDYLQTRAISQLAANETVVTWKGGSFTEGDLARLRQRHLLAFSYLSTLVDETQKRNGTPRGVQRDQLGRIIAPGIAPANTDQELVETYLLAKKGEAMGLVISDEAVMEFFENLSDEQFLPYELGQIFDDNFGNRFDESQLIEQMRMELLAQRVRAMAGAGLFVAPPGAVPPAQAWEYFQRLNRYGQFEVAAVPVAKFDDQVKAEPTKAQVQELYDAGKNRFPNPNSADPGFRRRRKSAFQYVRADFSKFLEEEKAKVIDAITDAEIEQHYEQNKQRYTVSPTTQPATPGDDAAPETTTPESATPESTTPESATPEKPAATEPETPSTEKPAAEKPESEKPEAPAPESPTPDAPSPAADQPTPPAPDAPPAPEAPTPEAPASESESAPATPEPDADSDASLQTELPYQFVSAQDADDNSQPDAPAPTPNTESVDDEKPAEDKPTEDKPTEEKPTEDKPTADKPTADKPAEGQPATEQPPAAAEAPPAAPEIRPLDDQLRQEIREEIAEVRARKPAQDRIDDALGEIRKEVNKFAFANRRQAMSKGGDAELADASAGPVPGIEELAEQYGLTADRIPLVNELEVGEYELGQAFSLEFTSWPPRRVYFADVAFNDDARLYDPAEISGGAAGVEFLYWKTDDEPAYTPDLAEAEDEVVAAWKHIEARRMAQAEAEKLQKQAAQADAPLAESLKDAGVEVAETNAFTWMTTGMMPAGMSPPMISTVQGVEMAGEDFMKAAFALEPGQVGVAMNEPQSIVYVLRMTSELPGEEDLREQFLAAGVPPEVSYISYTESLDTMRNWYEDIEKEFGVKWMHDPEDLGS